MFLMSHSEHFLSNQAKAMALVIQQLFSLRTAIPTGHMAFCRDEKIQFGDLLHKYAYYVIIV